MCVCMFCFLVLINVSIIISIDCWSVVLLAFGDVQVAAIGMCCVLLLVCTCNTAYKLFRSLSYFQSDSSSRLFVVDLNSKVLPVQIPSTD